MRIADERRFGVLEDLDRRSAADRRKIFQEDIERVASLQVFEEDSHWYPRANEYRRASHDLEV